MDFDTNKTGKNSIYTKLWNDKRKFPTMVWMTGLVNTFLLNPSKLIVDASLREYMLVLILDNEGLMETLDEYLLKLAFDDRLVNGPTISSEQIELASSSSSITDE